MQARPHHELSMQLLNKDQAENSSAEEDNLLSAEFKRLPYRFYNFWLILSFLITAKSGYYLLSNFSGVYRSSLPLPPTFLFGYIMMMINSAFLLYAYGEMLFAVLKRSSKTAQKSFLKLQYSIIILIIIFSVIFGPLEHIQVLLQSIMEECLSNLDFSLAALGVTILPVTHLFGCFLIVRVFEKNHPLARRHNDSDLMAKSTNTRDFLEQNEAIVSEVLRHDVQLKRLPYLIYQFFLKLVVPIEISRLCFNIFQAVEVSSRMEFQFSFVLTTILLSLSSVLNGFCCFEIGVAIGEKLLAKIKRAILVLKICIIESIIAFIFLANEFGLFENGADVQYMMKINFIYFGYCTLIPIVALVGAIKVRRILEEREQFVRVSSYSENSNL